MKLAAQAFTIRSYTQTPEQISSALVRLKEIGYDALQISAFGPCDPHWLRDRLAETGLEVCATHTPLARIADDTEAVIAEHKLLGAKYVGLGFYRAITEEEIGEFVRKISPAVEKIADAGLKFLYHNHAHEFIRVGGEWAIDRLLDAFPPEKFGLILDLYWAETAGLDPAKFLAERADRIPVVHFKDRKVVPTADGCEQTFAEVFEGNMDYEGLYRACLSAGVEWAAVEQDVCEGDPFECLARSRDNMLRRGMFPKADR